MVAMPFLLGVMRQASYFYSSFGSKNCAEASGSVGEGDTLRLKREVYATVEQLADTMIEQS